MANYRYRATIYDFGRDMCGNPTAHYTVTDNGAVILQSGKRRQQIGYDGTRGEAALHALQKETGYRFETIQISGDRFGNCFELAFKKLGKVRRVKAA